MFVPVMIEPGEVNIIKVNQDFMSKEEKAQKVDKKDLMDEAKKAGNSTTTDEAFIGQETSLTVEGFSADGDVMLLYTNKA